MKKRKRTFPVRNWGGLPFLQQKNRGKSDFNHKHGIVYNYLLWYWVWNNVVYMEGAFEAKMCEEEVQLYSHGEWKNCADNLTAD